MSEGRIAPIAVFSLALWLGSSAPAHGEGKGSGYLAIQRWFHEADVMANKSVTYEICGWGVIDLRTPFLSAAIEQGIDIRVWEDLAKRYDDAERERRRAEAILTEHGENAPLKRTSGLYATGGCANSVREQIEQQPADIAR
jgi:hypothetical protein